jgi:hypothetical protein
MLRYIEGFYEYEFAPNYHPRGTKGSGPVVPQVPPSIPATLSSSDRSAAETVLDLVRRLESILVQLEPGGSGGNLALWINNQAQVPPHVKFRMHAIRSLRNRVFHVYYKPSPAEMAALESDWAMIDEWWRATKPHG